MENKPKRELDKASRQCLVAQILSGNTFFKFGGRTYYISSPSLFDVSAAAFIYEESLSKYSDLLSEQDTIDIAIQEGIWSHELDNKLESIPKRIESCKVDLFYAYSDSKKSKQLRQQIDNYKETMDNWHQLKYKHYHLSKESMAAVDKVRYLLGRCLKDVDGNTVDPSDEELFQRAINAWHESRYDDDIIRMLVKNDPWREIWITSKTDIFRKPAIELNDIQRSLLRWSKHYDYVYEHPECPDDAIIEDDYLLDGWLIIQHNQAEQERKKHRGESLYSAKKDASEVFIVAKTPEDITNIEALNDSQSSFIKKQRMAAIQQHGQVAEQNMPDSKLDIQRRFNEMYKNNNRR